MNPHITRQDEQGANSPLNNRHSGRVKMAACMWLIYMGFIACFILAPGALAHEVVPGVPSSLIVGPGVILAALLLVFFDYYRDLRDSKAQLRDTSL